MVEDQNLEFSVRRAQRGDREAFEELVRRFEAKVFSIALKMTADPNDAKDVVQEVFLRVFRSLRTFDAARNFGVWLARIAVNCSYDWLRKRGRGDRTESLDELFEANPGVLQYEPSETPEERLDHKRLLLSLLDALQELPPKQRGAFVLKELEHYATSDAASILECDEATVRRHLAEARRKLRKAMERALPKT
ncbi:MAG: sigma-70 family RNA polymerase sigma factor [Acidobacteriota bacterium]|nr:MAG: sigma-70 family RNA polymerase sigma factor [Acidobacteriota bacterium]